MLSCAHYDYIEIACMQGYPVTLELITGECMSGTALDTCRNSEGQECIKLSTPDGDIIQPLDDIKKMRVNQVNPHFAEVIFR